MISQGRAIGRMVLLLSAVAGLMAASAQADPLKVLGRIPCEPTQGVVFCAASTPVMGIDCTTVAATVNTYCPEVYDPTVPDTRVPSWDGTPLDVNVTLPAGRTTNLPLMILIHGAPSVKTGLTDNADWGTLRGSLEWARRGYAVLSYSSRGFGNSCGYPASRVNTPACARGWHHLNDFRYEVRDTQYLAGMLADEGIINPQKIGVTGVSWGGGESVSLASLRNRMMLPDGQLVPWVSPLRHLPMTIAAAAPINAWSDIPYSMAPNGHVLDYTQTPSDIDLLTTGVTKTSVFNFLMGTFEAVGYSPPAGTDPFMPEWTAALDAGWPADAPSNATFASETNAFDQYHSGFFVPTTEAPAPTLYANGWDDDIFPVTEELMWANRELAAHPHAPISMFLSDIGHPRDQNKVADVNQLRSAVIAWFGHYLLDRHVPVIRGVEALTTTCPKSAASQGPYFASSWPAIHPGEVRFDSAPAQTVTPGSGDMTVDTQFDPLTGSGVCATASAATVPNTATYRFPVTGSGFTMIGSPTIIANLQLNGTGDGPYPYIAAHLLDVGPDGTTEMLVSRQTYRPTGSGRQVFQLYAQGWHFAPGHTIKLELAGQDLPYAAPDTSQGTTTVSNLELRIPTLNRPNCTTILSPAPPVIPAGEHLAPGVTAHPRDVCIRPRQRRRRRSSHRARTSPHGQR